MSTAPLQLLVIDDDVGVCAHLRYVFTEAGYAVSTAATGGAGLARLALGDVDLVLLDLCLPDLDGTEVCRLIRARHDPIYLPILMLTGLGGPEACQEGFAAGADDYIVKPYRLQDLENRVRVWAQTRVRLRELWDQQQATAAALVEARAAEARLEGVKLTARQVAHGINNHLAVTLQMLDLLSQDPSLPAALQEDISTAIGGVTAAVAEVAQLQRVIRVETRPTPFGPALDVERSVARKPA